MLLVSPPEADTRLYTISEEFGLFEVETEALFIAKFILQVMEKHGQTLVQAEIGVHVITMQQQLLTEGYGSWEGGSNGASLLNDVLISSDGKS